MTDLIPGFRLEGENIIFDGVVRTTSTTGTAVSEDFKGISFGNLKEGFLAVPSYGNIRTFVTGNNSTRVAAVASADFRSGTLRAGNRNHSSGGGVSLVIMIDADVPVFGTARAMVTATEGITFMLRELGIGRAGCSTDSGCVDQDIVVACRPGSGLKLTGTGKHSKLGEFIGCSAIESVKASASANGVSAGNIGASAALERLGIQYDKQLPETTVSLLLALLHIRDEIEWGMLPEAEGLRAAAAMASAVTGIGFNKDDDIRTIAEKSIAGIRD